MPTLEQREVAVAQRTLSTTPPDLLAVRCVCLLCRVLRDGRGRADRRFFFFLTRLGGIDARGLLDVAYA